MSGYERPKGKDCKNSKRVCQISLDGELMIRERKDRIFNETPYVIEFWT